MESTRVYHVEWRKIEFEEIRNERKIGLYQAYADHVVYGKSVLVYIGKTKDDIVGRLRSHNDFTESTLKNFEYYYGEVLKSDDVNEENLNSVIDEIEKILIKAHYPAYNAAELKGLIWNDDYFNTLILNWEDYGSLLPEVSGFRFSSKYWTDWHKKTGHF